MRMCCSVCHEVLFEEDMVFLDLLNTVTHQRCYSLETNLEITDLGTFKMVIENNPILKG